jgi:hypothetical protein
VTWWRYRVAEMYRGELLYRIMILVVLPVYSLLQCLTPGCFSRSTWFTTDCATCPVCSANCSAYPYEHKPG